MTKSTKSKVLASTATVGAALATTASASTENKEVIQAAATAPAANAPAVAIVAATSKASVANAIFAGMFAMSPVPPRKDMIAAAVKDASLTEKGAATYLQNYKAKNGLVQKKATAPAATA